MEEPTSEYCMTVHLFGATSSPCAAYVQQEIVLHSQETMTTVERKFYIDDLLKSVPNAKVSIKLSSNYQKVDLN